ncbi:hypothetical protein DIPPA_14526 [Diplonema papillatum]|nr:hypothetical protein DIPPA_14526 [Diplonema papillatum]
MAQVVTLNGKRYTGCRHRELDTLPLVRGAEGKYEVQQAVRGASGVGGERDVVCYVYAKPRPGCVAVAEVCDAEGDGWILPSCEDSQGTVFLKEYYSPGRRDHAVVAAPHGEGDLLMFLGDTKHQYHYLHLICGLERAKQPGTVPLYRMWHGGFMDTRLASEGPSAEKALTYHYRRVRVEGYVFLQHIPHTRPLRSFHHSGRKDSAVAVTDEQQQALIADGFVEIGTEGYVYA